MKYLIWKDIDLNYVISITPIVNFIFFVKWTKNDQHKICECQKIKKKK